jgi:fructokinase
MTEQAVAASGGPLRLAVETGGTKIVAKLVGDGLDVSGRWPTSTPQQAQADLLAFVTEHLPEKARVSALGIASFGPILLNGPRRGTMLATPKPHWAGSNLAAVLADRLGCPFAIETDVNAAALAEHELARGIPSLAYLTVGTGIGGGLSVDGAALHGALHPEIGHLTLERAAGDAEPSCCPFHANCAEGLTSGPAIARRLGGASLDQRRDIQSLAASYIGQLLASLVLAWTPHRIVLGGGLGAAPGMLEQARQSLSKAIGSYGVGDAVYEPDFLMPPTHSDAGLAGALLIADREIGQSSSR